MSVDMSSEAVEQRKAERELRGALELVTRLGGEVYATGDDLDVYWPRSADASGATHD